MAGGWEGESYDAAPDDVRTKLVAGLELIKATPQSRPHWWFQRYLARETSFYAADGAPVESPADSLLRLFQEVAP